MPARPLRCSPNGQWVNVAAETGNSVAVIDTRTDAVVSNFLVEPRPRAVAWAPDGARVSVSNEISGTLAVIDGHTRALISTVSIDGRPGKPAGSVVAPDGRRVYVGVTLY
jgi:large repetitive protein